MPTYWKGHNIVHFAASKKHIGLYPGPAAVEEFAEALKGYKTDAKLHALDPNNMKESAKARGKDQRTMEVEAESIAAVVSSYFGIDTSANSWGYVASWSRNKELPELTASLQVIKDTAGEIISGISEEMEEMRFAYMDKADALEAIRLGQTVYASVGKGRFEEVTEERVRDMSDDTWLRMPKEQMRAYVELRTEKDLHEEMTSLEETQLLYMPENQFGIYQIDPEGNARDYMFLSHDSLEDYEMRREDYRLEYVAPLTETDTLDTIYERFNIDHPEDFQGHSLSVSDIVVMNRDGEVKAYFVDSFGFTDVTEEFLVRFYERPEEIREAAFEIEDRYLEIHETDGGYDYSIYSDHYQLIDGGRYESDVDLMRAAKDIVQDLREPVFNSETGTYTRLPLQGNINANSRMRRISFSFLHEMTLEFNRIDPERMVGAVQETSSQQQYRPLAKVEEMEEQNRLPAQHLSVTDAAGFLAICSRKWKSICTIRPGWIIRRARAQITSSPILQSFVIPRNMPFLICSSLSVWKKEEAHPLQRRVQRQLLPAKKVKL